MEAMTDIDGAIYLDSHAEALTGIASVIGPITKRGEAGKLAVKRALCEHLAGITAAGNGIEWSSDFQAGEAARAAYDGILSWCAKEKGFVK